MRRPNYDAGRWLLQRQRLHLSSATPPPAGGPVPIGGAVEDFLKRAGLHAAVWRQRLQAEWPEIVGEVLARRTRPGEVRDGTLAIYVGHSIFLHELARDRAAGARLLANLRERLPDAPVRAVRFEMDPGEAGSEPPPPAGSGDGGRRTGTGNR